MISPLANSAYIYINSFSADSVNDIARLLAELPALPTHAYFITTLALYTLGLLLVFRRSRHLTT